jgi:cytochrome c oxidase subunit 2
MNLLFCILTFVPLVALTDAPEAWQIGFQDPATPIMQGIIDLHHDIMFFMVVILVFVLWMITRTLYHFHYKKNPIPEKVIHGTAIEIAWTVTPSLILVLIAVPSFALLYSLDEVVDPAVTIKVIGHQWYWSYEINDGENKSMKSLAEDSYMFSVNKEKVTDEYLITVQDLINDKYVLIGKGKKTNYILIAE